QAVEKLANHHQGMKANEKRRLKNYRQRNRAPNIQGETHASREPRQKGTDLETNDEREQARDADGREKMKQTRAHVIGRPFRSPLPGRFSLEPMKNNSHPKPAAKMEMTPAISPGIN